MSHFYGSIPRSSRRNAPTACATRAGLTVRAASWGGAVEVELYVDDETGKDCYIVRQTTHQGEGCSEFLVSGEVGVYTGVNEGD